MPRNLSLNISVGAAVDKTLGATFKAVTKSTGKLGKEHKELQKQFRAASGLKRYKEEMSDLTKVQKKSGKTSASLQRRIDKISDKFAAAKIAAKKYGIELGSVIRDEKRLSRELAKQKRAMTFKRGMNRAGGYIGTRTGGAMLSGARYAAGGLLGAAIGMPMYGLSRSADLYEQKKMAGSVGIGLRDSMALEATVKGSELNYSHINDLFEEQQNKFGENAAKGKKHGDVVANLAGLGLDYDKLEAMNQMERFMTIMDKAAKTKNFDKAKSAVDAIFGAEANKYLGLLKDQSIDLRQFLKEQKASSHFTAEAEEALVSFNESFIKFKTTLLQGSDNILIQAMGALTPTIEQWKTSLDDFFSNDARVNKMIDDLSTTFESLGEFAAWAIQNTPAILSGLTSILGWLAWFGDTPETTEKKPLEQIVKPELANRTYGEKTMDNGDSDVNKAYELQQQTGQKIASQADYDRLTNSATVNNEIHVHPPPGASPEAIAAEVVAASNRSAAKTKE